MTEILIHSWNVNIQEKSKPREMDKKENQAQTFLKPFFSPLDWFFFYFLMEIKLPREATAAPGSLEIFKAGWGLEQSGMVEVVPAHGMGLNSLPTPTIPRFHDFTPQNQLNFPSLIPNIICSKIKAVKNPGAFTLGAKNSSWSGKICPGSNKSHFWGHGEWKGRHSSSAGEQDLLVYPTVWKIHPWNVWDFYIHVHEVQRECPVQLGFAEPRCE